MQDGRRQRGSRRHDLGHVLHEPPVGLVAQDQSLVAVEEGDAVVHRLHGEEQPSVCLGGLVTRRGEPAFLFDDVGEVAMNGEHAPAG